MGNTIATGATGATGAADPTVATAATVTWDANEAAADVAFRLNEVIAIYPITPASPMGEHADAWAARGRRNLWGAIPRVVEMQSEGGAAGAVHGALQAGSLTTTFTASQGLLLMLPNLYKIAGELTACAIHVAARSVATHALSIFGDHSDVYAARQTGWAMLAASSVQEAHDFAAIAHIATLRSRVPFLHFFDGFRTSHEIAKIQRLSDDDLAALVPDDLIAAHRARALSPEHPVVRGTAQNPDVFFQAREACQPFYDATPAIVQDTMDRFADRTGRQYRLFEYAGHPQAERVIALMGSGAGAARDAVDHLAARGEKVGAVIARLYRPFDGDALAAAIPDTARALAVLDRTKEPGSAGEPLHLDALAALYASEHRTPMTIVGGRYGLSSKEFTPAMIAGVFDELAREKPKNRFTVGIRDDVCGSSLDWDDDLDIEPDDVVSCVLYGLGSDGTVSANKSSIKIIGEHTDHQVQGYFVYDSKKSGAMTVSHLRFGPRPLRSTYLIRRANFVACHQWQFLDKIDVLERAAPGATLLLNAPYGPREVFAALPRELQQAIIDKGVRLWVIDGHAVAREAGLGGRLNTVMQTCFFAISGVLPREQAIAEIKRAIEYTYGKRGRAVVERNFDAVDTALAHLYPVDIPDAPSSDRRRSPAVPAAAPDFVQRVTAAMLAGHGDRLPVSAFTPDGTWPTATAQWEKRNLAQRIPVWDEALCIQCNKCALVCPHAAVRTKAYPAGAIAEPAAEVDASPPTFKSVPYRDRSLPDHAYTVQIAPEDCTGCTLCVDVCPARDKSNPRHKALDMADQAPLRDAERQNYEYFLALPEIDRARVKHNVKSSQLLLPLFEYSGACSGCGETPYLKLLTQLLGDRAIIANATGCSSIYGGNLPTTPYAVDRDGRGPAWSNSLFEDNAEFGVGMRLAADHQAAQARDLVRALSGALGDALTEALVADVAIGDEAGIAARRDQVRELRVRLPDIDNARARALEPLAEHLIPRAVWIVGGDGWAYDIGYGGLDHALASGLDINVLVLDTEVYSNTGGQKSKATPLGATAKFAASGKDRPKKDLGLLAMAYGDVYVAQVALGAKDKQTLDAFVAAAAYPGPSLIIAYSHCIAHGYDLSQGLRQQKLAVDTGYWPLYRYDPRAREGGGHPLVLDSAAPTRPLSEFAYNEARFRLLLGVDPERARALMNAAQADVRERYEHYRKLADID